MEFEKCAIQKAKGAAICSAHDWSKFLNMSVRGNINKKVYSSYPRKEDNPAVITIFFN